MSSFSKVMAVVIVLIIAASVAACGDAKEQAEQARQLVGEALVGEPTPAPVITREELEAIFKADAPVQELNGFAPFEICGNGLDDDQNGQTDADDLVCQIPDEEGVTLSPETVQRMELTASLATAQDAKPCKVTVVLSKIEFITSLGKFKKGVDDEFNFTVAALGKDKKFPPTGKYKLPPSTKFPHTIKVNKTVATKDIGKKGDAVPVNI